MDIVDACDVVELLADGIDPNTGEIYLESSPYQHPRVVRALYTVLLEFQQRQNSRNGNRGGLPAKAGKPWSPEEDSQLAKEYDAEIPLQELARRHERTRTGIEARLLRLGKLDASHQLPWRQRAAK